MGEIKMFAGTFAPNGWYFCDGALLSIAQNSALFSLLGITYGGDGQSTFQLPDLRGRTPIHCGNGAGRGVSPYQLGQIGGTENVTISAQQMPAHNHLINTVSAVAKQYTPNGGLLASSGFFTDGTEVNTYSANAADGTLAATAVAASGGNQPLNVVTPYLGINYIIAWTGIYPSRP
ncbi:phage tail protein [Mucilaginibacter sp. UYNi724]